MTEPMIYKTQRPSVRVDEIMIEYIDAWKKEFGTVPLPDQMVKIEFRAIRRVLDEMFDYLE